VDAAKTMGFTYKPKPENPLTAVHAREIRRLPDTVCWDRFVLAMRGIATVRWPSGMGITPDERVTFGHIGEVTKPRFVSSFVTVRAASSFDKSNSVVE
jgi:hypothetical protein